MLRSFSRYFQRIEANCPHKEVSVEKRNTLGITPALTNPAQVVCNTYTGFTQYIANYAIMTP